ncbi:MAG: hypothetical protein KKC84_06075, partial [Candidatus Omnitrophica bacterium]|nr:hypothetical protein [Candidatus Omnitrophota bacterium]
MMIRIDNPLASSFRFQASGSRLHAPRATHVACSVLLAASIIVFGLRYSYAQDDPRVLSLAQKIVETEDIEEIYLSFEDLADIYFADHAYNEMVTLLQSLQKQKESLRLTVSYYTALARYYQLKYLQEVQNWQEYFNEGKNYRKEVVINTQQVISSTPPSLALHAYSRLIQWLYYKDHDDPEQEDALGLLMEDILEFAKMSKDISPLKDVADRLFYYEEKHKARVLYKIYVEKLVDSSATQIQLQDAALNFYREGNLELAQSLYDVYIQRMRVQSSQESLIPVLSDIARLFSDSDKGPVNSISAQYAEKIFAQLAELMPEEGLDQGLLYLRALNLEHAREYAHAKELYVELAKR